MFDLKRIFCNKEGGSIAQQSGFYREIKGLLKERTYVLDRTLDFSSAAPSFLHTR